MAAQRTIAAAPPFSTVLAMHTSMYDKTAEWRAAPAFDKAQALLAFVDDPDPNADVRSIQRWEVQIGAAQALASLAVAEELTRLTEAVTRLIDEAP